jgi:tRNA G26 N,N-dimethylase Trm1
VAEYKNEENLLGGRGVRIWKEINKASVVTNDENPMLHPLIDRHYNKREEIEATKN